MLSRDKILKETSPLSIFFVKSGCGGNRLLFRYPYDESFQYEAGFINEPLILEQDRLQVQSVIGENDEALCNMFSVHPNLCGKKFEIKINSVRHVGHPMSLLPPTSTTKGSHSYSHSTYSTSGNQQQPTRHQHHQQVNLRLSNYDPLTAPTNSTNHNINQGDITSFNIVCALRSSASYDIVDCYHDLSKRLAIALSFEERRCSYLSKEIKTILSTLDESDMAKLTIQQDNQGRQQKQQTLDKSAMSPVNFSTKNHNNGDSANDHESILNESVFSLILNRSNLARDFKRIFISLSTTGVVDLKINNWVSVSFCLPQKVHRLKLITHKSMPAISTSDIKRCLLYLRPYHGLLLLYEPQELLDSLPIDASPAFIQLIKVTKPDKNFMDLSVDSNLTLMQIFCIVSQLIYWAKATVIYPICDSNIYAIHPLASTGLQSQLVSDFQARFPSSKSLHHYLADFSEGTSLSQLNGPLINLDEKLNLLSIVTWLLQRRILIQIHKYIFLVVDKEQSDTYNCSTAKQIAVNNQDSLTNPQQQKSQHTFNPSVGIEINRQNHSQQYSISGSHQQNRVSSTNGVGGKISSLPQQVMAGTSNNNSNEMSPQMFKNSLTESLESSLRRYQTDSLPESQEDSNFGLNSSLSSTPNSNLEYPSPNNDPSRGDRFGSLSSSCPLDNPLSIVSGGGSGGGTNLIISALQRAGLSQAGAKNVLAVPSSKSPDDLKLLIRLIPYFDGKHHVEDIMFFENLERSQVLILCDKFREILFTCHYEDVAVSQLSPFGNTR